MSAHLIREFFASSPIAGGNAAYVEALYEAWLADASAVAPEWRRYFESLKGREAGDVPHAEVIARIEAAQRLNGHAHAAAPVDDAHARKQAAVLRLLTAFRSRGHLAADLDPLGLAAKHPAPDLELAFHGLSAADLETEFDTGTYAAAARLKLEELIARLKATYTGSIGAEFMHISDAEQRRWLYTRMEQADGHAGLGRDEQIRVLEKLWKAAYCFHAEGSLEADLWVIDRALRILFGEVGQGPVKGIRQSVTKRGPSGPKCKTLNAVANYLYRNRARMRHHEYLANGWPIASGPVEGACKNLIKDRMERSGMRWTEQMAEAIVQLRAIYPSGDFDPYWEFHIEQDQRRLYPAWTVVLK